MRVVGVSGEGGYGGPEALRVFELPDRHADVGEVRIAVHAAAVNPTDTFTRIGARHEMLKEHDPPYVAGMDVAGVIDEIGPDTDTDLAVGDRVMAIVVPQRPARRVLRQPGAAGGLGGPHPGRRHARRGVARCR